MKNINALDFPHMTYNIMRENVELSLTSSPTRWANFSQIYY